MARARASNFDNHLLWTWGGVGHFHQNWIGLPLQESQRPHRFSLFLTTRLRPSHSNPRPESPFGYVLNDPIDPSASIGTRVPFGSA